MANNIQKFKKYIATILDAVYKVASKTAVLDGAAELAREGANADELVIPMIEMDGLADYDRASGYKDGNVTLTNETVKCNFDRGRMFTVDNVDNMDTAGVAFSRLGSEFIRTKVTPELDAFRIAKYVSVEGADVTADTYTTGEEVLKAIAAKADAMTDAEVPEEDRHLFITSTLLGLVRDLDTTKSKEVLNSFASIQKMPQSRFYSAIAQGDNGYAKAEGGHAMNFLIVHKPAVIQYAKHVKAKVVDPDTNQNADAWKYGYRNVSIADAYKNKAAGIAGTYNSAN